MVNLIGGAQPRESNVIAVGPAGGITISDSESSLAALAGGLSGVTPFLDIGSIMNPPEYIPDHNAELLQQITNDFYNYWGERVLLPTPQRSKTAIFHIETMFYHDVSAGATEALSYQLSPSVLNLFKKLQNVREGSSAEVRRALATPDVQSSPLLAVDLNDDGVTPNNPGDTVDGPDALLELPGSHLGEHNRQRDDDHRNTATASPIRGYLLQFYSEHRRPKFPRWRRVPRHDGSDDLCKW